MRFSAVRASGGLVATLRSPMIMGLGIVIAVSAISVSPAEARKRNVKKRPAAAQTYSPPYAAIVVDANTGKVLHGVNENALRHPASITKVMTLYLLFEQLERGRISLTSKMPVSAVAARQAPSKLGLRPGSTIEVEDAIKALITKSANDVSVVIAEHLGGSVDNFARMMTAKARALGMSRTVFVNPNGLPDPAQVTTARDLSILGRAVHDRFPRYYRYFATPSFTYAGRTMRNHNNLLGRVEGMEGIKTGYIRASGFNLLSAVKRDNHYIVSVVLGGKTARARDNVMAGLIEKYIDAGGTTRTAALVTERGAPAPVAMASNDASPAAAPVTVVPPPRPEAIGAPMQLAPSTPMAAAALAAASAQSSRPRPAVVAAHIEADREPTASLPARADGSTTGRTIGVEAPVAANAATTPSGMRWVVGPKSTIRAVPPTPPAAIPAVPATTVAAMAAPVPRPVTQESKAASEAASDMRPAAARTGWMIQIGATADVDQANELLARARTKTGSLSTAKPFTEKVKSGNATLYRARFAGLDNAAEARAVCNDLKKSGFGCFATRN